MTVQELIDLLQKVELKEAYVYLDDSLSADNIVEKVITEHDLDDDEICVVLKKV